MKKRKMNALLAAAMVAAMATIPACTTDETAIPNQAVSSESSEIMPLELELAHGDVSNATDWEKTITLAKPNGDHANFYIENNGDTSITISINGSYQKEIAAGENGFVTATVSSTKSYVFRAVPSTSGKISVHYDLAQRS